MAPGPSMTLPSGSGADTVSIPFTHPLLQQLSQAGYPRVRYWHRQTWKPKAEVTQVNNDVAVRGKSKMANGVNVQFRFVEDENGEVQSGWRIGQLLGLMREVWREFESKGRAPSSWKFIPGPLNNYFRVTCYDRFPELRYCEAHWKVDYIATHSYSGWGGQKLPPPIPKQPKNSKRGPKTNISSDYMHMPHKRDSTHLDSGQKSSKKLKVPVVPICTDTVSSTPMSTSVSDVSMPTLNSTSDESSLSFTPSCGLRWSPEHSPVLPAAELASENFVDTELDIALTSSTTPAVLSENFVDTELDIASTSSTTPAVLTGGHLLSATTPSLDERISASEDVEKQVAHSLLDLQTGDAAPASTEDTVPPVAPAAPSTSESAQESTGIPSQPQPISQSNPPVSMPSRTAITQASSSAVAPTGVSDPL